MALNSSILRSQLIMRFNNSNATAQLAASNISNAFDIYIKSVQNMAGGSYTGMPGISLLRSQLTSLFQRQKSNGNIIGQDITGYFQQCLLTLLTLYQTAPPTFLGLSVFQTKNRLLFSKYSSTGVQFATELSNNIHNFVSTTNLSGITPVYPFPPFSGPAK